MHGQQLGRLATVNGADEPYVVPSSLQYNEELDTIDIGGHNLVKSKKSYDAASTRREAFAVDDVLPPWQPRGDEVRGRVEVFREGEEEVNPAFDTELIRLHQARILG